MKHVCLLTLAAALCGCGDSSTVLIPNEFIVIAFDDAGDIYQLNTLTGARTLRRDSFVTGGGDVGAVSAATWVPARNELWIGVGGRGNCIACTMVVNLTTGLTTLLFDNSVINNSIPDLALRPSDGTIYTTEADGSGFRAVNNTTGEVTNINVNTNSNTGNGLTFDAAEVLYLAAGPLLCTVVPSNGGEALVASLTYTGFPAFTGNPTIVSMSTHPVTGSILCIVKDSMGTGNTFLAFLNKATGEVTNIAMTATRMDGIAHVPLTAIP